MIRSDSSCGCRWTRKGWRAKPRAAFTLVEVMIVVAIIGIVIMIAAFTWMRQREMARSRSCQENLQKIDGAKEQYAMDNQLGEGDDAGDLTDLVGANLYIRRMPVCSAGGTYSVNTVGADPSCDYEPPEWAPNHDLNFGDDGE